jgi:hypothetical protein
MDSYISTPKKHDTNEPIQIEVQLKTRVNAYETCIIILSHYVFIIDD